MERAPQAIKAAGRVIPLQSPWKNRPAPRRSAKLRVRTSGGPVADFAGVDFLRFDEMLDDEECVARDSVREFVQERIAPFAAEWDKSNHFPAQELKQMGELGLGLWDKARLLRMWQYLTNIFWA